ncbi:hypothetical protein K1T35_02045 [Pseudonocardia sp. DSM 110487]|uniref:hypothetical protein n=1 Tax=Pseudonocardia sp. DSM 110487 TaxID=2865833 RepID=UPI001C6A4909|nr:hypothetical protein [Pseudonocardia sp. DSM 110487]QYN36153.1 hypothetical protein K1T35_02045 [Pseudonocardia sp. DSM 110487]
MSVTQARQLAEVSATGAVIGVLGAIYGVLVGLGRAKPGMFAPAVAVWFVGFPLARLLHETATPVLLGGNPTPPDDVVTFLAFQAVVSLGFAIGFVWLYERITPSWLIHIKGHNPYAERVYGRYVAHAEAVWAARERKRARRAASTGVAARGRTRRST